MRAFCSYSWTFWVLFDTKNRPNFRVLEFFGEKPGKGSPPPYFGGVDCEKQCHSWQQIPFFCGFVAIGRHTAVQQCSAVLAQGRQIYPKTDLNSGFWSFLEKRRVRGAPPPILGALSPKKSAERPE